MLRRSLIDLGVAIKDYAEEQEINIEEVDLTDEYINAVIGQGRHANQSFFAFTATPKGETIEVFGTPYTKPDGTPGKRPFHVYSMKQAIDEEYDVRDYLRKFTRTYSYVTQIVRLHDKDLFAEYLYTSNLLRLLPKSGKDIVDIDDKVKLEYANLKETHTGAIILDEKKVVWTPSGTSEPKKPNKKKDTLQSIIDKVNERFDGQFTEADRVIIEGIYRMFMDDKDVKKFKKYASDNSTEMFVNSLFPDKFKEIVTQCFLDNNESFQKLFNDPEFYQKVQDVMAKELYKTLRKD